MTFDQKFILFFATGFYSGKIPFAPGTFGTMVGVVFALLFLIVPPVFHGAYMVSLILAAIFFAEQAEKIIKKKDPGCIVIDEIAGYVVTMSVVPVNVYTIVAGFFIFRFFDILKFRPVKYFEDRFSGGAGIVLDDIMAGILSAIVLRILYASGIV